MEFLKFAAFWAVMFAAIFVLETFSNIAIAWLYVGASAIYLSQNSYAWASVCYVFGLVTLWNTYKNPYSETCSTYNEGKYLP